MFELGERTTYTSSRRCWRVSKEGRSAGHTPGSDVDRDEVSTSALWRVMTSRSSGPTMPGSALRRSSISAELTAEWQASISAAGAWLLFIRLSTLKLHEDLLTRPPGGVTKPHPADGYNLDGSAWDDRARYVEILQMLLFAAGQSTSRPVLAPRLAVMFSCWDELDEEGTPEQAFRERLPLLHAFIRKYMGRWFMVCLGPFRRSGELYKRILATMNS